MISSFPYLRYFAGRMVRLFASIIQGQQLSGILQTGILNVNVFFASGAFSAFLEQS